jgi:hypothetical protein
MLLKIKVCSESGGQFSPLSFLGFHDCPNSFYSHSLSFAKSLSSDYLLNTDILLNLALPTFLWDILLGSFNHSTG